MPDRFLFQPFRFGRQGGVAVSDDPDRHMTDKILAVLFTARGERVNRPDFGVGLGRFVFEGIDELSLAALEYRVSQGLERDIGDELILDGLDLTDDAASGRITLEIAYRRRTDRLPRNLEIRL